MAWAHAAHPASSPRTQLVWQHILIIQPLLSTTPLQFSSSTSASLPALVATHLGDERRQLGVAVGQPAAKGHAVGLVLEALGEQLHKVLRSRGGMGEGEARVFVWNKARNASLKTHAFLMVHSSGRAQADGRIASLLKIAHNMAFVLLTGKMSVLMISEWMAATPLTAKEPTTAR